MPEAMNASGESPAVPFPGGEPAGAGGRVVFAALLVAALAVTGWFRREAWSRTEAPFLADSVEYLLMGRAPVTGEAMPVKPVRPGVFGAILTVPFRIQERLSPEGASLGYRAGLVVPLLFWILAVLGTYRLGCLLAGRWAGLLAAFYVAVQPQFVYWSSDFLTDVPAAAAGVWAVVLWIEHKPLRSGVLLGTSVVLRYQSLIPMAAFLAVPLATRRWKDLGLLLLGLLPPAAALGMADAFYWGTPFHSFLLYVPRQLTTFLPLELVQKILPVEAVQTLKPVQEGVGLEAIAHKPAAWYLTEAPKLYTWELLVPLLLAPLASRRLRSRAGALFALWIAAATLVVLSIQRYKEIRYVLFVSPLLAALAASGASAVGQRLAALARRVVPHRPALAALVLPGLFLVLGAAYTRRAAEIQSHLRYRPFGNTVEAFESIPAAQRPFSVVLKQPWLMAVRHSWDSCTGNSWYSPPVRMLDLDLTHPYFGAPPNRRKSFRYAPALEEMDYFIVRPSYVAGDRSMWRWLNERTLFDGYFLDWRENLEGVVRLKNRRLGSGPPPFWRTGDPAARDGAVVASFHPLSGSHRFELEWIGAEVRALPGRGHPARVQSRWRLPRLPESAVWSELTVRNPAGRWLATFREWVLPDDPLERRQRGGAALSTSAYGGLAAGPGDELVVELRAGALAREGPKRISIELGAEGPGARRDASGWLAREVVRVLPPEPPSPPPWPDPGPPDG